MRYDTASPPLQQHRTAPRQPVVLRLPAALPAEADAPLYIRDRFCLHRVHRSCFRSLHAAGNYVEMQTGARRFVLRGSLSEMLTVLGAAEFLMVNRKTAVNIQHLQRVDSETVEVDGQVITLTRAFRKALLDRLNIVSGR